MANCFIYRCSRKDDMYIYLPERDDFSNVPADIIKGIGITEFAMEIDLTPETRLAREDAGKVLKNMKEKGFHLQLPSETSVESIMMNIARRKTISD